MIFIPFRVRDVAWSPSDSLTSTIASCGVDGQVIIWRCSNLDADEGAKWTSRLLRKYDDRKSFKTKILKFSNNFSPLACELVTLCYCFGCFWS